MSMARTMRVWAIRGSQGYTLLELLAALAITGMVIAAMGGLLINGQRACRRVDSRSEMQESARVGLEMMARDIKSCRTLEEINGDRLGLVGSDGSKVSYRVASATLYRSAKGAVNPVANEVKSLIFCEVLPGLLEISLTTGDEEFSCQLKTRVKIMTD